MSRVEKFVDFFVKTKQYNLEQTSMFEVCVCACVEDCCAYLSSVFRFVWCVCVCLHMSLFPSCLSHERGPLYSPVGVV